jgi:hypothetical protein
MMKARRREEAKMRAVVGVLYWLLVGLTALFALYGSAAMGRLFHSWWLIPAALTLLGAWWPGLRYSGVGLIIFGADPALLVTTGVLDQVVNTDWSCSKVAFDGIANPNGGNFGCTTVSVELILFGLGMLAVALLGAFLQFRQSRHGGA